MSNEDGPTTFVDGRGRTHVHWPYAPLEAQVRARLAEMPDDHGQAFDNAERQAELLGTYRRSILRWRTDGMTTKAASKAAEALGFLPYEIWPEMLDMAIADAERTCEAEDCTTTFVREHGRRFCSRPCQRRHAYRRGGAWVDSHRAKQRKRDAAARDRNRAYARNRYQRTRDRDLAEKKAYYMANRERILAERKRRYWASKAAA